MNHKIGDWEQVIRNSNEIFKTLTTSTDQYGWRGDGRGINSRKCRVGRFHGTMRGKKNTWWSINICKASSSRKLLIETTMRYTVCFIPTRKIQIKELD